MMAIAGAARGAAQTLEQILSEQMIKAQMAQRERENQQRIALDQERLAESTRQFNVGTESDERKRRDGINRDGLELMQRDKGEMDMDTAVSQLPPHLKPVAGIFKAGGMGKLSPEDFQSPEDRAKAADAEEQRQIRIRRASVAPTKPEEKKPMVVTMPDGSIKDLNNVLPPGAVPYDQVAARSSKPEDTKEAMDTAREVQRIAMALRKHGGLNGAFGAWGARIPTMRQGTADAEVLLNSLSSLLTMENMGKMKGVLSDSDMKVLRQASTTLSPSMSESAARAELERIAQTMSKTTGDPVDFGNAPAQTTAPGDPGDPAAAAAALIERARAARKPQ
jgi:hypothetical protein